MAKTNTDKNQSNRSQSNLKSGPNSKCVVLVPAMQTIESGCEEGLHQLENLGYAVWRRFGCSDISMARSTLAAEAIEKGYEELMWIDSDILFKADDVSKLRAHRLPIVGGAYTKKGDGTFACIFRRQDKKVVFGVGGGAHEVEYLATGFLLTHRKVYDRIRVNFKLPKVYKNNGKLTKLTSYFGTTFKRQRLGNLVASAYLSEDYGFCYRARQCGFAVWADTSIRLGHIGHYVYSWEDLLPKSPRLSTLVVTLQKEESPVSGRQNGKEVRTTPRTELNGKDSRLRPSLVAA